MQIIQKTLVLVILFFTWPVFLSISLLILLFGGGLPIIFKQRRIGKDGKIFVMYKFRTMIKGAERHKKKLLNKNEASPPVFKIRNDPRFTKIGKFLSHTGLDELPQFINILKNDMNFIGPRPLPVDEAMQLLDWHKKRESIKPGIISPWLFNGYHESSFDEWMKWDLGYIKNKNLFYDFKLVLKSIVLATKLLIREVTQTSLVI